NLFALVEDTALVSVPDPFIREVIETRMRPAITEALSRRLGRRVQVAVTVRAPEDGSASGAATIGHPGETGIPGPREPEPLFDSVRNDWVPGASGSAVAEHPVGTDPDGPDGDGRRLVDDAPIGRGAYGVSSELAETLPGPERQRSGAG